MTREEILDHLKGFLVELFDVPEEDVILDSSLYEDLDLDSIDAVDLVIKLQDLTGKKIAPEEFRTVRTVADVVDQVSALVSEK
ncbi:acyl carrier protein [Curvivirga aplysinae]|uniref:acyl carrier protein n=1 Tax=Curvivirga aplysinae TaxID=2529852 RepID=UPI0012BD6094|nr:acyl carrier protein [Curvivirga aplysinae]MTI11033.1 acyl carrier protein [Curvivirga aplysinae]